MSRLRLVEGVHIRAMRLLVFAMITAIAMAVPFDGSAAPSARSVVARDSFSRVRAGAWGVAIWAAGIG